MVQVSDAPAAAWLLAFAGGGMDGYAFATSGVFANAQTGNVVLLGIGTIRGDSSSLSVLAPILAFLLGALVVVVLPASGVSGRTTAVAALGVEVVVLLMLAVVFGPDAKWPIVIGLAFVAALQTSAFRSLKGQPYSTTMTTSDLRVLVRTLWTAVTRRDRDAGRVAFAIGGVVAAFCLGAGVTACLVGAVGSLALLVLVAPLLVVLTWSIGVRARSQ